MQRIVAGALRGRKLMALPPRFEGVRPSSSRVRSAVFDRLQHEVRDARILDLFAGSGALSIEALSRGAASATLVEFDPALVRFLSQQISQLALSDRMQVHSKDALAFLGSQPPVAYDIVLVDPPYAERSVYPKVVGALLGGGWICDHTVIVVEHERARMREEPITWPPGIRVAAERTHGGTVLEFLEKENDRGI